MLRLPRFIAILLFLALAGWQTASAQFPSSSTDPLEIARAINSQKSVAAANGFLNSLWEQLKIPRGAFEDECGFGCHAQLFRQDLDNVPGNEIVLKLVAGEAVRYLIFRHEKKVWRFVDYIDHNFNRYQMSTHRVLILNGRKWLIVRGQEGSGSGYSLYSETVYEVSRDNARQVLSFWSAGHTYPWPNGLGREFKARVLSGPGGLAVVYTVDYAMLDYINDRYRRWLSNIHRLSYRWDKEGREFVLDSQRSNITEDEANAIAGADVDKESNDSTTIGNTTFSDKKGFIGGGYEVFLKENLAYLLHVAKGPASMQKQWLQTILPDAEDTPEKAQLTKALNERSSKWSPSRQSKDARAQGAVYPAEKAETRALPALNSTMTPRRVNVSRNAMSYGPSQCTISTTTSSRLNNKKCQS